MRILPVVALGTVVALALGGAAYASTRDDDEPPLPKPKDGGTCSSASDVNEATSEILADNTVTAKGLRDAATVLRNWTTYCDDAAKQAGQGNIALLEAKAAMLEKDALDLPSPYPSPAPTPTGSLWPVPPGYTQSKHTTGLHGELGNVFVYPNGDFWFFPDDSSLIPYYIPGGSKDISTQGCKDCRDE